MTFHMFLIHLNSIDWQSSYAETLKILLLLLLLLRQDHALKSWLAFILFIA